MPRAFDMGTLWRARYKRQQARAENRRRFFASERVLVTGASKGIGRAICRALCANGAQVVGVARGEGRLRELQEELGPDRFAYKAQDLSDPTRAQSLLVRQLTGDRPITALVLNAGYSASNGAFGQSSWQSAQKELALNYSTPAAMLGAVVQHATPQRATDALPAQAEARVFRVVCVSSLTALVPFPRNASYAASKAAFYHLLRSVRLECAGLSALEISAVLPGLTDTEMSENFSAALPRSSPESVAAAVLECWDAPAFPKIVGWLNRFAGVFNQLSPEALDTLVRSAAPFLPKPAAPSEHGYTDRAPNEGSPGEVAP